MLIWMSKQWGDYMSENENDFYVDEYGEIHRQNAPQRVEDDALWREYHQL